MLARLHLMGALGPRALAFATRGCERRDTSSCMILANLLATAESIPHDPLRADEILAGVCRDGYACAAPYPPACNELQSLPEQP